MLMNTGSRPVFSQNGLLTSIAWTIEGEPTTYMLEGSAFICGAAVQWLRDGLQILDTAAQSEDIANKVPDSGGVYFVPAFTGLGAPYWDMYARGTIVGITRGVNRAHVARSVLEAITYQMTDLLEAMKSDSGIDFTELRVDGGASVSDIMLQIQADMIRCSVNRPRNVETTALGAAYLAGLAVGLWESMEEIQHNRVVEKVFTPEMGKEKRDELYDGWKRAVECSKGWAK
jgi:glycerol kinase